MFAVTNVDGFSLSSASLPHPILALPLLSSLLSLFLQALRARDDERRGTTYSELLGILQAQGEAHFHLTSPSRALGVYMQALRLAAEEGDLVRSDRIRSDQIRLG